MSSHTVNIFANAIQLLRDIGAYDFFFPFLLVFAIIYGMLEKTAIFGAERRDINAIIAFVIAFIFGATSWTVQAVQHFIPYIGLIAVASVGFLMLAAMFWPDLDRLQNSKIRYVATGLIGLVIILLIIFYLGLWDAIFDPLRDPGTGDNIIAGVILTILLIGGILVIVGGSGKGSSGGE